MAIKVCPNGHRYNTDTNPTCPYCDRENSDSNAWSEMELTSKTQPLGIPNSGGDNWPGVTEPIYPGGQNRPGQNNDDLIQPTVPIGVENWNPGWGPQPDNPPAPTTPAWNQAEYQHQPVVGWLVCIEGPDKGKDFVLHGAKSTVGRRKDSSVYLSDKKISQSGFPALIVYDDRKSHKFYLASGDASAHNNVELGGNMLLGQSVINPYDEIRIEDTVLVFVPFCGDEFFWTE